jgi:hypothetical protein
MNVSVGVCVCLCACVCVRVSVCVCLCACVCVMWPSIRFHDSDQVVERPGDVSSCPLACATPAINTAADIVLVNFHLDHHERASACKILFPPFLDVSTSLFASNTYCGPLVVLCVIEQTFRGESVDPAPNAWLIPTAPDRLQGHMVCAKIRCVCISLPIRPFVFGSPCHSSIKAFRPSFLFVCVPSVWR